MIKFVMILKETKKRSMEWFETELYFLQNIFGLPTILEIPIIKNTRKVQLKYLIQLQIFDTITLLYFSNVFKPIIQRTSGGTLFFHNNNY